MATKPLPIGDVIFPLRYDIVAQAPFIGLYQSRDWGSLEMVVSAARCLMLKAHITMLHEHERDLVGAETLLAAQVQEVFERYYRARVEKLADLCDSLSNGWDYSEDPIMFNQPSPDGLTSMGNPVPPGHFLCNGQHRLVALYGMGKRELLPDQYGLRPMNNTFIPLETTGAYVQAGLVTEEQFVEFARLRLAVPLEINTVDGLFEWAYTHALDWLCDYIKLYWR